MSASSEIRRWGSIFLTLQTTAHKLENTLSYSSLRSSPDVVSRQLGESIVLIRLTTNRIYELNATGSRVWEIMQNGATRSQMIDEIAGEFDAPAETIATELDDLLTTLITEGLVLEG